uniref:histone H2B 1/2-like n=1 Tax=Pristiophorus japonicus TaxID=55135 RepID=UPI00398E6A3E
MPEEEKAAPKKGTEKAASKVSAKGGKKRRRFRKKSYLIYIYKVMKQVHPNSSMSSKAMSIMNDIFQPIASEASKLAHYNKHSIISSQEIQTAMHLQLPRNLVKCVVLVGTEAVTSIMSVVYL